MSTFRFPNESDEYRRQRDRLLDAEVGLRAAIEAVAEQRRALPPGGALKEAYRFAQVHDGDTVTVPFADLFGRHDTLLLYSMMFGPAWDAPCPSCAHIVDGLNISARAVGETAAMAVVAAADPVQLHDWSQRRGWRQLPVVSARNSSYLIDYAGFETDDPALVSVMNVFHRTPEGIFHCWASELLSRPLDSGHPRHVDIIWPLWNLLDLTPAGRGSASIPRQDYEHRYFSQHVLGEGES